MEIKNIILFIKKHTGLFFFLFFAQLVAVMVILFSYGIYMNNQYEQQLKGSEELNYHIQFKRDEDNNSLVEESKVVEAFPEVLYPIEHILRTANMRSVGDIKDMLEVEHENTNRIWVESEFSLSNGKYTGGVYSKKNLSGYTKGEWFTEEQYNSDENIIILPNELYEFYGDSIFIGGETYKTVAYEYFNPEIGGYAGCTFVPLEALSDEMMPRSLYLEFTRPLTRIEYEKLVEAMDAAFGVGNLEYDDFFVIDVDDEKTMKTMTSASIVMALVSALTVCLIYRYILSQRVRMTAVYRICGSTAFSAVKIYAVEMAFNLFVTTILGVVTFRFILMPKLADRYVWFLEIFSQNQYYRLIGIYLLIVVAVNIVMMIFNVKKSPVQMIKAISR